jgi:hypothetical protein
MSYHPLANDTGGTADDRRNEADRILEIIAHECLKTMTPAEYKFLGDMEELKEKRRPISAKQLFWLRDIKDKYL